MQVGALVEQRVDQFGDSAEVRCVAAFELLPHFGVDLDVVDLRYTLDYSGGVMNVAVAAVRTRRRSVRCF
jgi:hypothetical protein